MIDDGRCFHTHPPLLPARLAEGERVSGTVVCVHIFGLGLYLQGSDVFGHVDAPFMGVAGGPLTVDAYPQVGVLLDLVVVGYSGTGQLRLRVV